MVRRESSPTLESLARWRDGLRGKNNPFLHAQGQRVGLIVEQVRTWEEFRRWPLTTKADLLADQVASPPWGTNLGQPLECFTRMHQTSGSTGSPLRWLDTPANWQDFLDWWQTLYGMAGVTARDRVFFPFSFGPFLGFWAAFDGAVRLGSMCLPGGGLTSVARLRLILDLDVTVVCCTPTYALRLAEVAAAEGLAQALPRSAVRLLILAGEPGASIPATRQRIEAAWGARVIDHWGMTELGPLGGECLENPGGFHLLESACLAEVIDPTTLAPLPDGELGELVITHLGRWDSPVVRYRTGDLVRLDPRPCPCGRPWRRVLGGVLGRMDDMFCVRGNNVFPGMLEALVRREPSITEFQIQTDGERVRLLVESPEPEVADRLVQAIRDAYHFRAEVVTVAPGTLPRPEMKARRLIRNIPSDPLAASLRVTGP